MSAADAGTAATQSMLANKQIAIKIAKNFFIVNFLSVFRYRSIISCYYTCSLSHGRYKCVTNKGKTGVFCKKIFVCDSAQLFEQANVQDAQKGAFFNKISENKL